MKCYFVPTSTTSTSVLSHVCSLASLPLLSYHMCRNPPLPPPYFLCVTGAKRKIVDAWKSGKFISDARVNT